MKLWVLHASALALTNQVTNDFYKNGLAQISNDWDKLLAERDAKSSINNRLDSKFSKIVKNLEKKDDDFRENDKLTYPYLDGTFASATKNVIDSAKPCKAIDLLEIDIKQWTSNFIEGAARPCGKNLAKSSCYSAPGGALEGQEVNKKWHKRTLRFVKQNNQKIDKLVTKFKEIFSSQCEPGFGDWGAWSACSVTCGLGNQKRMRECLTGNCIDADYNDLVETKQCRKDDCGGMFYNACGRHQFL